MTCWNANRQWGIIMWLINHVATVLVLQIAWSNASGLIVYVIIYYILYCYYLMRMLPWRWYCGYWWGLQKEMILPRSSCWYNISDGDNITMLRDVADCMSCRGCLVRVRWRSNGGWYAEKGWEETAILCFCSIIIEFKLLSGNLLVGQEYWGLKELPIPTYGGLPHLTSPQVRR